MRALLASALVLATALPAQAQLGSDTTARDTTARDLGAVTVTATRTAKEVEDVAMPITVVTAQEIQARGAVRLSDVLEDVPGLTLTDDFGTGLSMQGFTSDYTLILLDGEPIVGREAGTLDLERLTVAGIDRVEVVRGPSSSLYGSEALAGVVNLVTALPSPGATEGGVQLRAGSYGSTDAVVEAGVGRQRWAARAVLNRNASAGYDLTPDVFGQTVPTFADVTADLRSRVRLGRSMLRLNGRLAWQEQAGGSTALGTRGEIIGELEEEASRVDGSAHAELRTPLGGRLSLRSTLYGARYATETVLLDRATDGVTYQDDFDQRLGKAEVQLDGVWSVRHLSTLGLGGSAEALESDRYGAGDDARPRAQQVWAFAQHEWLPSRVVELNASARFDAHSDYAARLTPRLSVLVRPTEALRLRASVGSGFKAPAFRQLYLAFTNAAGGYTVFGSERLGDAYQELAAQGQIQGIDPAAAVAEFEPLRAESSVALNAGVLADPARWVSLEANAYLNEVRDLIETRVIATRTNGQPIYAYANLDRIYTRGVDLSATVRPAAGLELQLGYNFLQARDRDVVDQFRSPDGVFERDAAGAERQLALSDYGALFDRSPHALTARAELRRGDAAVSARGRWRSRYGFQDLDGNGIASRADEFVDGFAVVDLTASHAWPLPGARLSGARLTAQAGVDNVFDTTRPTFIPSMPGRTAFVALGVTF